MRILSCLLILMVTMMLIGCVREDNHANTPMGNFEALWTIIDEHYCFLDYKQIDWYEIRKRYQPFVHENLNNDKLFQILSNMLAELKDGHVNLYAYHNTARYWNWFEDYPRNYSEELVEKYLGHDYRVSGGLRYTIFDDNIGYVSYTSFSAAAGNNALNEMFRYLDICNGLIIDVRCNGGGDLTNASRLAGRFTNEKVLVGYMCHKTGKGHSDFSKPEAMYIDPSDGIRWQKPVVVLTNRHSYSATNDFVNSMRYMPQVTLMGDQTGGGSGMPFSSELPNGWGVRFSACPTYDANMQQIEFGIEPDIAVGLDANDQAQGFDTIIEAARAYLNKKPQ
ncbi:MAG: S41 family peptidase [Bacteroidaceae bacterium]|nr:S41 family peptidase [Bacteroidaceae bacterium]